MGKAVRLVVVIARWWISATEFAKVFNPTDHTTVPHRTAALEVLAVWRGPELGRASSVSAPEHQDGTSNR